MKKTIARVMAVLTAAFGLFSVGCGHSHSFENKLEEERFLKSAATCEGPMEYYYSCSCGEVGEESFTVGEKLKHDYSGEVVAEEYLKTAATCQENAVYYKSCVNGCGKKSFMTFTVEGLDEHSYTEEVPEGIYIKEDATKTSSAVYYKSCICGLVGTETFTYGDPVKEYTEAEKVPYTPTSLTVTLYDTENAVYGFTYNTRSKPLRPVIQVAEGTDFVDYEEYTATVEEASSYTTSDVAFTYYIVKAEVVLKDSTTYTYRAYDKYVDVGTDTATLITKDLDADTFSFVHVSDSQMSTSTGARFGEVLSNVVGKHDFVLHTGDVVETSKHEDEWTDMLHDNFAYLSRIPMMALSGNHETTYKNGANETYKHFHNKMPDQDTELGYYYSFVYGNAKFIMLNTNRLTGISLTNDQYAWLVQELENNTATWTVVALHNPVYSAGNYGSDPSKNAISLGLRAQLQGIFAEYGVDVVLQGHDHVVSRTHAINGEGEVVSERWETSNGIDYSVDPQGVVYVMNGPAGTQTRNPNENMDSSLYKYAQKSNERSWAEFSIDGNRMTVRVNYVSGNSVATYQTWGIVKTARATT
ncbi:MAG: metallophosphoesterase [Clostridia bacterium]|nr:metallophosphoesterase [Clostridia bacterium]